MGRVRFGLNHLGPQSDGTKVRKRSCLKQRTCTCDDSSYVTLCPHVPWTDIRHKVDNLWLKLINGVYSISWHCHKGGSRLLRTVNRMQARHVDRE